MIFPGFHAHLSPQFILSSPEIYLFAHFFITTLFGLWVKSLETDTGNWMKIDSETDMFFFAQYQKPHDCDLLPNPPQRFLNFLAMPLVVLKAFVLLKLEEWLCFLVKPADWSSMVKLLAALRFERESAIECLMT